MKEYVVPGNIFLPNPFYIKKPIAILLVHDLKQAKYFVLRHVARSSSYACLSTFFSYLTGRDSIIAIGVRESYQSTLLNDRYCVVSFVTTPIIIAEYYGYKMYDFTLDTPGPILADALEERANERLWPITSEFTDLLEILRTDYSHLPINNPNFAL